MPGSSARDEDAGAHSTVHPEDEPEVVTGRGAGNTPTPGWPVVTAVLVSLKAPEGISVRGFQGPVPLLLPGTPAGSQGQGVPKDRASPPLRTGLRRGWPRVLRGRLRSQGTRQTQP